MPSKYSSKDRVRFKKLTGTIPPKSCELNEPLWAIVDGKTCLFAGLTYSEAAEKIAAYPAATIVTSATAARII